MDDDRLNILLVEDNEDDYLIVRDLLRDIDAARFILDWADSYADGLRAIQAHRHDLILLDFRLSDGTGLELLQETQAIANRAPVIFMTGQGDHAIDVQVMQAGAADYLAKDRLDADLLERAIRYAIERRKSAEALRASEDRYRTFIENSVEGIWRFELEKPLPMDHSEEEQIAHLYQYAFLAECNDTMARFHGFERAAEPLGKRLGDFFPREDTSDANSLLSLIRSGYRLMRFESFEFDHQGQSRYVLHHLIGVIEKGFLLRIWGSQTDITERKQAELAQSQLAAIVEASADAIISTTLDGLIVTWNKGAEAIYGYTAQEVTGQLISCIIPSDCVAEMDSILECVRRGQRVSPFDTVRLHKDGRRIDASVAVSPILDALGQVNGSSSITRDISEQKRAALRLRQSEANMATAQRIAHFGSWELEAGNKDNIRANPLYCSDETFHIFGYEPLHMPVTIEFFFRAVSPEDQPTILQAVAAAVAQRQGYSLVHRLQRPDGEERIVRETAQFFEGAATGQPPRLVGTVHDITEQQRAEESIRFNALLLSQVRNAVISTDLEGKITYWNNFAETLYQWKAEEVIGKNLMDLLALPQNQQAGEQIWRQIQDAGHWEGEFSVQRKDGSAFPAYVVNTLLQDMHGVATGFVGVSIDITERKQAEEELERTSREILTTWESMTDAFFIVNAEWQFTYLNSQAALLLQRKREDLIGFSLWDTFPEAVGSAFDREYHRALEQKVSVGFEEFYSPLGKWIEVHAYPSALGLSVYFRDISDRKNAEAARDQVEEALRASEHKLRLMLDSGRFGTFDLDLITGRYLEISKIGRGQFALPSDSEVFMRDFFQIVHPDDRAEMQAVVARASAAQETDFRSDYRIILPHGSLRWISVHGTLTYDDTGRPIRMLGVTQDITGRKQAEDALRQAEQEQRLLAVRLAEAQAIAKMGSWETDLSTMAVSWSAETYRIFEVDPDQGSPTHQNFLQMVHPADRAAVDEAFVQSLEQSGTCAVQHRVLLPDGRIKFAEECWQVFRDAAGKPVRALGTCQDITERRQAEKALHESEQRLRALFDSTLDAILIADNTGRYLDANPAACALLGMPHSRLVGMAVTDFVASMPGQQSWQRFIADGFQEGEIQMLCAGGVQRSVEYRATTNFLPGQHLSVLRDITERKQAEEERDRIEASLRQSERRFRSVVEKVESLVIHDQEGRLIDVNQNACDSLGYTREELLQLRVPDYELRYNQANVALLWAQMVSGEKTTLVVDGLHQRKDGSAFPVEVRVGLMETEGPALMVAVARDVTDRKQAEEERDRFFTLSLDMLAIISSDGYIKRLNPSFEATLGFSDVEMMAKPFLEFVHPEDIPATLAEMGKLDSGIKVMQFENRYVCRDGSYKWMRWMCAPYGDLWYCVAHDVTALKQAAAALQQANDDLEARVEARTQALQWAMEESDRANAAKSDFLSRMSHELRTPMNSILGFAQIMEMDAPSDKQAVRIGHIIKAGQHLLQLINEVLDLARVESGRLQLSSEPVSLGVCLQSAIDMIRPLCEQRGQQIVCDWSECDSLYVHADQQRLSQVLINLLSNATKYNRDGGVILVQCEQAREGWQRVSINDSGAGISAEQLAKLFQPFERLGADGSAIEGTGLGLALSKRLVELMGGVITVESVVGSGSTFRIDLPCAEPQGQEMETIASRPVLPEGDGRQYLILYIEDNLANLQLIEHVLADHPQYQLLNAQTGLIGLDMARKRLPSLILLDLHLPGLQGDEVLVRLQADPATRGIPVVIVSADATSSQIRRLLAAGAAEYLTKPLDVRLLNDVLHRILQPQVGKDG